MSARAAPGVELPALTSLRGLAAWFVVLYHIRLSAQFVLPGELLALLSKGYLAVDFFFMLSGFVLWLNYAEKLRSEGLSAAPLFLARRLARIWPLHAFILAGAAAFALLLVLLGKANHAAYPWHEFPLHLLLLQNWGFTSELSWNVPAWSISCELAAYILFPFLVVVAKGRPSSLQLVLLVVAIGAALDATMRAAGANTLGDQITRLGLIRAFAEFTMGTIVCVLWIRWRAARSVPLLGSLLAATLLALGWIAGLIGETLAVPLIFASLLLAVGLAPAGRANLLNWKPIHYLGEISYSTYLVHFLLFVAFKLLFVTDETRVPLPVLGGFLVLTLIVSVLLHHLVERPAQRMMNRAVDAVRRSRVERLPFRRAG